MPKKTKTSSKRNAAARSSLARGSALLTDPDGRPYHHDPKKAYAAKLALAEGDGPVSNETAHAYLAAYPADDEQGEGHEPETCPTCRGSGQYDDCTPCPDCDGDGTCPW